jgi:hypothetical protein
VARLARRRLDSGARRGNRPAIVEEQEDAAWRSAGGTAVRGDPGVGNGDFSRATQREPARPRPVVLNDDGGWCWFQDERALVVGDRLVFGSVAAGRRDGPAEARWR